MRFLQDQAMPNIKLNTTVLHSRTSEVTFWQWYTTTYQVAKCLRPSNAPSPSGTVRKYIESHLDLSNKALPKGQHSNKPRFQPFYTMMIRSKVKLTTQIGNNNS
eukprot:4886401-Amphidinium_carterae.1